MAKKLFYRINDVIVPDEHHPQHCPGVLEPALSGELDGIGRPISPPGFNYTVFKWDDVIHTDTYRYYRRMIGRYDTHTVLRDLVVPDLTQEGSFSEAGITYPYHAEYTSAILWRIELMAGEDAYRAALNNGQPWIRGGAKLKISSIGAGPFY